MTLRIGTGTQTVRNPSDLSVVSVEAYLMLLSGSTYVLGAGSKATEAAAFLVDAGGGLYTLDSDPVQEDRKLYQVSATGVIA